MLRVPNLDSYVASEPTLGRDSVSSRTIIEIQGHTGSGKTHLLYFLLGTCILPFEHLSTFIGGWKKAAFVFDMDGHFRISRFREILAARLRENLSPSAIPSVVEKYLRRLHIFRPTSSDQLAITLKCIPKYHSKLFPDLELGMITIHSIDAFYWLDRFKTEQIRSVPAFKKPIIYQHIMTNLHNILLSCNATLVMTHGNLRKMNPHDYATDSNIHIPHEASTYSSTSTMKPNSEPTLPLTFEFFSRHQILLNLHIQQKGPTVPDSRIQEIQALSRIVGRDDFTSFKFYISRHGINVT